MPAWPSAPPPSPVAARLPVDLKRKCLHILMRLLNPLVGLMQSPALLEEQRVELRGLQTDRLEPRLVFLE